MAAAAGVARVSGVAEGAGPVAGEGDRSCGGPGRAGGDPRCPACVSPAGRAQILARSGPAHADRVHYPEYQGGGFGPVVHRGDDGRGRRTLPLKTVGAAPELFKLGSSPAVPNEDCGSCRYFFAFLALRLAAFFLAAPLRFFAAAIVFPLSLGCALANPVHHPTQHSNTDSMSGVAKVLNPYI